MNCREVLSFEEFLNMNYMMTNSDEEEIFTFNSEDYGEYFLHLKKEDMKIIYEKIYLPHIKHDPF